MEIDRAAEWLRLTEVYREMYDDELRNLAAEIADLTEVAQQVLRDEIKRRRLDETPKPSEVSKSRNDEPGMGWGRADDDPNGGETSLESGESHEYTWKTPLCERETSEEAWQISEVLRRAGIESWIERTGAKHPVVWDERMVGELQILVAADQLEEARAIAARPIPQDIIDESRTEEPEFEPPICPNCRSADVLLESADPVNAWECEACGHQWTEPAEEPGSAAETARKKSS